ncbi:MAG TPA: hypothetical protein VHT75_18945 [Acidimicrobiales bacterium]|jgi:hypothetical protein|nr:hypothetical protein [Acidimicrobiales bacterium]
MKVLGCETWGTGRSAPSAVLRVAAKTDASGNLHIPDSANNRVRTVATNGIITTIAGTGVAGFGGDGGLAMKAQLNEPSNLAFSRYLPPPDAAVSPSS